MEEKQANQARDLGLTETELAFHNILMAEITNPSSYISIDEVTRHQLLDLIRQIVKEFDNASQIAGSFQNDYELRRMRRIIRRAMISQGFEHPSLIRNVIERFMDLWNARFR